MQLSKMNDSDHSADHPILLSGTTLPARLNTVCSRASRTSSAVRKLPTQCRDLRRRHPGGTPAQRPGLGRVAGLAVLAAAGAVLPPTAVALAARLAGLFAPERAPVMPFIRLASLFLWLGIVAGVGLVGAGLWLLAVAAAATHWPGRAADARCCSAAPLSAGCR